MHQILKIITVLALISLSTVSVSAVNGNKPLMLRPFVSLPSGLSAEGLAIHNGTFYVGTFSFAASDGTILVLDGDGSITSRFTVPGLPQVGQVAFVGNHTLFAVAGNITSGKGAVVSVDLDSRKVATVASGFKLPNGLAADQHGNLFVSDLLAGTISRVALDGTVSVFASGPLLAPGLVQQVNLLLGPNDVAFDSSGKALYVTNIGQGTIVKIDVNNDGSAGSISKFASVPTPDGLAFDTKGNLYVTSPFTNSIWTVSTDGSAQQLSINTSRETLSNPSNVAFSDRLLYVTNLGLTTGSTKISVTHVAFPGLPLEVQGPGPVAGLCSSGRTLTIGELTDLTDGLATQGASVRDASLIAIGDVNSFLQSTGCNLNFAISVSDYALDPSRALAEMQAFSAAGVQVVVGPLNSGTAQFILSFANSNHIVLISPSSTSLPLAIPNDFLFRTSPNNGVQGLVDARILVDRGVKAVILLQRNDAYGNGVGGAIATRFGQLGGTVVDTIRYDTSLTDFTSVLSSLNNDFQSANSTNPNQVAIYAISFEEINQILSQTDQQHPSLLNTKLPWFGTDGEALDPVITGNSTTGVLAAQVRLPSPLYAPVNNTKTVAFLSKFAATYPGNFCDSICLNAYDDVWLAALATLQAGSYNGTLIQSVMLTTASNYSGVTGQTLLDANGDRAASVSSYQIWKVATIGASPTWVMAGTWDGSLDSITWTSPP